MSDPPDLEAIDRHLALDDGGAASGMPLRDYFAAHALQQISLDMADRLAKPMTAPAWHEVDADHQFVVPATEIAARVADAVYLLADAMLTAKQKP